MRVTLADALTKRNYEMFQTLNELRAAKFEFRRLNTNKWKEIESCKLCFFHLNYYLSTWCMYLERERERSDLESRSRSFFSQLQPLYMM